MNEPVSQWDFVGIDEPLCFDSEQSCERSKSYADLDLPYRHSYTPSIPSLRCYEEDAGYGTCHEQPLFRQSYMPSASKADSKNSSHQTLSRCEADIILHRGGSPGRIRLIQELQQPVQRSSTQQNHTSHQYRSVIPAPTLNRGRKATHTCSTMIIEALGRKSSVSPRRNNTFNIKTQHSEVHVHAPAPSEALDQSTSVADSSTKFTIKAGENVFPHMFTSRRDSHVHACGFLCYLTQQNSTTLLPYSFHISSWRWQLTHVIP